MLGLIRRSGAARAARGTQRLAPQPERGEGELQARYDRGAVRRQDQEPAGDGADQDGEEGAGLDQRVARHQLVARQEAPGRMPYLTGPKNAACTPEAEQHASWKAMLSSAKPSRRHQHHADLPQFHDADEALLLELVGELARRRREQEIGQDEDRAARA